MNNPNIKQVLIFLQAHLIMILSKKSAINIPSVLAVDDNPDNTNLLGYVLEAMNFNYYGICDSRSVFDLAVKKIPNLILLDIVMPYLSGFDVMQQLKSNLVTKNIPVIAVTGLVNPSHLIKIESAGFDDYVCKPFILRELEIKVVQQLGLCLLKTAV